MYPSSFYGTPNGPFRYNWRPSCVKQSSSKSEAHHLFGSDSEDESPSGDTRSHNTKAFSPPLGRIHPNQQNLPKVLHCLLYLAKKNNRQIGAFLDLSEYPTLEYACQM